jgi:hypothetical protein
VIETQFYILSEELYEQFNQEAEEHGMKIDHYLLEFCEVKGPPITLY